MYKLLTEYEISVLIVLLGALNETGVYGKIKSRYVTVAELVSVNTL